MKKPAIFKQHYMYVLNFIDYVCILNVCVFTPMCTVHAKVVIIHHAFNPLRVLIIKEMFLCVSGWRWRHGSFMRHHYDMT